MKAEKVYGGVLKGRGLALFASTVLLNTIFFTVGLSLGRSVYSFSRDVNTDGMAYYLVALNPFAGAEALKTEAYRYSRLLYPLTVYAAAHGDEFLTALLMEVFNILYFAASVLAFYKLLSAESRGYGTLFYIFNPIMLISANSAMSEPLFFTLAFSSIYLARTGRLSHSSSSSSWRR